MSFDEDKTSRKTLLLYICPLVENGMAKFVYDSTEVASHNKNLSRTNLPSVGTSAKKSSSSYGFCMTVLLPNLKDRVQGLYFEKT